MTQSNAAPEPLRVGIVGAGAIVRMSHLPSLSRLPGLEPVAIADPSTERTEQLAQQYGLKAFAHHGDMIEAGGLDAVLIAIPNDLHRPVAEAAAAAGLHIFSEKPVAHNLVDALAIEAAVVKAGVHMQIGFNQRFWNPVQMAKRAIDAGVAGPVKAFRSVYSEAHDVYPSATKYRYDLAASGGASILDLAIHRIDLARYLVGDIVEVCATVDHTTIPHAADDNVFLLVRFESGATGVISSDRFSPQVSNATDLYGPDGTIHLSTETINPFQSVPLAISSKLPQEQLPAELVAADWPQAWWESYVPGTWLNIRPPRNKPYDDEWTAFAAAVAGDVTPSPSIHDGVKAQEVVTAAYRSVRTHGWVSLPLDDPQEPTPIYGEGV